MRRRKHKHDEHVNLERWLVSYADFITLLFILFLILYASSSLNVQKFEAFIESFRQSNGSGASIVFDQPGSASMPVRSKESIGKDNQQGEQKKQTNENQIQQKEDENFQKLKEAILDYAKKNGIDKDFAVEIQPEQLHLSITGTVLFENGKADLLPEAKKTVQEIFNIITRFSIENPIRIEGHTDNRPIATARFPSNWELSSARAVNLLRYLIEEYRLNPRRLSAAAYGEHHPVATNNTEEGRSKNRRVEIYILRDEVIKLD